MVESGKRQKNEILRQQMENERTSFISQWREIGEYIRPRRTRFSVTDTNKGDKRNSKIIDSTATLASRTARAGMSAGITSPARPWFRLSTSDSGLAENQEVKSWLETVTERMRTIFLKSNLYKVLPILYGDILDFSTGAILQEEDMDSVTRFYSFPVGSYMLANDEKLNVKVFLREFRMTVRQVVDKFAEKDDNGEVKSWDNISSNVEKLYREGNLEVWIDIYHVIKPNEKHDPDKLSSKFKKYISQYYEKGTHGTSGTQSNVTPGGDDMNVMLRERGYDFFPVLAPRWEVAGEDVYGTSCPGMDCLGDVKALQTMQKRKAQAEEKLVNPPLTGPSSLRNVKVSILPGDTTWSDTQGGEKGLRPTHEVDPRIQEILLDIQDHQQRISKCYYEDLFLMLSNTDRREITAREIDERHEEKLLALGPVLEQLNQDLLDPLIDNTFNFALRQGQFPEPPEELQGIELKVEYVSIMAQAQKIAGISNIERFTQFTGNLAAVSEDPTVWDKVDKDELMDVYADRMGVDVDIIVSDEDVLEIRQGRARAQQAQQAMEMLNQGADTAQKLSSADMGSDNALTQLVN